MGSLTTEKLHDLAEGLDLRPAREIAAILAEAQAEAAGVVAGAADALAAGAAAMAETIERGGRLHYAGAGSSGLMAAADALELGGTFAIPEAQVRIVMAGGLPTTAAMPGDTEDETAGLAARLADIAPGDTMIAVAASGSTPFTLEAARVAKRRDATVVAVANNPGTPLLAEADIAVTLETPPEVLSGSTRLGAGTAQKIALNCMSTLMGLLLGAVHDGMMVDVVADNAKLRARAAGIVARLAGVDTGRAAQALDAAGGEVKTAVLALAGAPSQEAARALLAAHRNRLRAALDALRETRRKTVT